MDLNEKEKEIQKLECEMRFYLEKASQIHDKIYKLKYGKKPNAKKFF